MVGRAFISEDDIITSLDFSSPRRKEAKAISLSVSFAPEGVGDEPLFLADPILPRFSSPPVPG
jgi:hypothetical protein